MDEIDISIQEFTPEGGNWLALEEHFEGAFRSPDEDGPGAYLIGSTETATDSVYVSITLSPAFRFLMKAFPSGLTTSVVRTRSSSPRNFTTFFCGSTETIVTGMRVMLRAVAPGRSPSLAVSASTVLAAPVASPALAMVAATD